MQSISLRNDTRLVSAPLINRFQDKPEPSHDDIRDAVRAWAGAAGQDVVTLYIVEQWRNSGGEGIDFPADVSRARQKLFRFLDNRFDSDEYRERVRQLAPAIIAVLPLEYRGRLVRTDCKFTRLAAAEKEIAEAKQAVILDAPKHQKLKEMSEGVFSMLRLEPDLAGPVMEMVTNMLGAL
ncbi:toxin YdaT family protein [Cronobacter dublinensis]